MGKASRHKREQREATKFAVSAELAARADAALALVVNEVEKGLTNLRTDRRETKLDLARWALVRQRFLDDGATWPSWSWLPPSMVMAQLDLAMKGLLLPGLTDDDLGPYVKLVTPVLNWLPGRTAVLYDPDVLASFTTALDGERIPVQALYRLPGWGLYMDCPFIGNNAGVFVCLDAAEVHMKHITATPDGAVDELMMTFVLPDNGPGEARALHAALPLSEPTVSAALAAQLEAMRHRELSVVEAQVLLSHEAFGDIVGQPLPQLLATVTSMVLFLCTEEPDLTRVPAPLPRGNAKQPTVADGGVRVLNAGWRLGAALRAAKAQYEAEMAADPTGRRVTPHLRRPHWHSYWTGPRADPEARQLVLRYLPPIQVGSELPTVTVVRPASQ